MRDHNFLCNLPGAFSRGEYWTHAGLHEQRQERHTLHNRRLRARVVALPVADVAGTGAPVERTRATASKQAQARTPGWLPPEPERMTFLF